MNKQNVMDRIKSISDVAKELNIDFAAIDAGIMQLPIPEKDKQNMIADYAWEKITEALNESWIADYSNGAEDKYWPYAYGVKKDKEHPSGFGFTDTNADWARTVTHVSVRLLFKTATLAQYAIAQFPDQYKAAMLARRGVKS